jgi:hypothetical protein
VSLFLSFLGKAVVMAIFLSFSPDFSAIDRRQSCSNRPARHISEYLPILPIFLANRPVLR